jgi:hypothetical protein
MFVERSRFSKRARRFIALDRLAGGEIVDAVRLDVSSHT